jgi:hypothetical protein
VDIEDLLPNAGDLQKVKKENFEHAMATRLARDLRAPAHKLSEIRRHDVYDLDMFYADFPGFPWEVVVDRVERYSVQELFQKPTKSPVFASFTEHFPEWSGEDTCLLIFKARGFTTLVMGTPPRLETCSVVLKASIRGHALYVTTYEEFIDAVRDLGLLEA